MQPVMKVSTKGWVQIGIISEESYSVTCAFCGETVLQTDNFIHFDEKSRCRKRKKDWRIA